MLPNPEDFLAALAHRRSMGLSRLKDEPVDRSLIERMLEAANWGPSHGDTEPWRFTIFMGEGREALADLYGEAYLAGLTGEKDEAAFQAHRARAYKAPVWISLGLTPMQNPDGTQKMSDEEELMATSCAIQNLHLMASLQGLAGMWHSKGLSVNPKVAEGLGLTHPSRLLGFFFCGWPDTDWPAGERRPIEEKTTWVEGI